MRVLFVCQNPVDSYSGGVQHITYELSDALYKKGIESIYLSVRNNHIIAADNNFFIPNPTDLKSAENKQFIADMITNNVDLVVNQCGIDFELSDLIFDSALGRPVITCFHNSLLGGIDNFYHLHQSFFKRFRLSRGLIEKRIIKRLIRIIYVQAHRYGYKRICRKSKKVIVLTNSMFSELKEFVGSSELNNVEVIPNFVSPIHSFYKKEKMIIYVGRIDRLYKQTDLAIGIWAAFSESHPDYHFHVIGDGKDLDYVKRLAAQMNCSNIHFEGQNNPEQFYNKASLLMFTSCSESFGLVLIEAMAHGIVPIAFDSYSAIREIIDDGVNGCLIKPFDISQFVEAMNVLVDDKDKYDQISNNAIAKAGEFSSDVVIEKWLKLLETVK